MKDLVAALSTNTSTDEDHGLVGHCQVCHDPLPPFWSTSPRHMHFCCGAYDCNKCSAAYNESFHEKYLTEAKAKIQQLTSGPPGILMIEDPMPLPRHCPLCQTMTHHSNGTFTRELQELVAKNVEKGYSWAQLLLAADHLGMTKSMINVPGNSLIVGGVRDIRRGIKLLELSAKQGNPLACYSLAQMYYHGHNGIRKSVKTALSLHRSALQSGHALSGMILYSIYEDQGNTKKAFECMELASKLGAGTASGFIGMAYEDGKHGMEKNIGKALQYFKIGAEQGDAVSQFFAARLCKELLGDEEQVIKYLKMAAEQGYTDAQCHLGKRYVAHGKEWIKSEKWSEGVRMLRRAQAGGCKDAARISKRRPSTFAFIAALVGAIEQKRSNDVASAALYSIAARNAKRLPGLRGTSIPA